MLLDLMQKRRSIRAYKNQKIEPEKIQALKQAALLAPTSKNKKGWEFIFVENKDMLDKLAHVRESNGGMIANAALAIVVTVDSSTNDTWIEDGSIAGAYLYLMAESLGLGSCWIQIRNRYNNEESGSMAADVVKNILNIPHNLEVECIMSVGYKGEEKIPQKLEDLKYNKIHIEKY